MTAHRDLRETRAFAYGRLRAAWMQGSVEAADPDPTLRLLVGGLALAMALVVAAPLAALLAPSGEEARSGSGSDEPVAACG